MRVRVGVSESYQGDGELSLLRKKYLRDYRSSIYQYPGLHAPDRFLGSDAGHTIRWYPRGVHRDGLHWCWYVSVRADAIERAEKYYEDYADVTEPEMRTVLR